MKIYYENRYAHDDDLILDICKNVLLKNTALANKIIGTGCLLLMCFTLIKGYNSMAIASGLCAVILIGGMLFLPKKLSKKVIKNTLELTGGGENLFQFGEQVKITQGSEKATLEYDWISKAYVTKQAYILKFGKSNFVVLKKGCFTKGSWEELRQFIKKKRPKLRI